MKALLLIVLSVLTVTSYSQNKLKPHDVSIEFTCTDINPEEVVSYLIACNLPDFKYTLSKNKISFRTKVDLDSLQLSSLFRKTLGFQMYPLISFPEPTPILSSYTLDEELVNQVVMSEYIMDLKIPMVCTAWKSEYLSSQDSIYKLYVYDCSNNSMVDSSDFAGLTYGKNFNGESTIEIRWTKSGQKKFYDASVQYSNKYLMLMISQYIFSAPRVIEPINQPGIWITGMFNPEINLFLSHLFLLPYIQLITINSVKIK